MILTSIELRNFGPYHGYVAVDLSVSDGAPIVLVHGENERGKTSFANAIRWCLYGRAKGRAGRDLSTVALMNWEALDAGAWNMSVKLEFEHGGKQFRLTRHVQASHRPTRDADLEKITTLEINGQVQAVEQAKEIVSGILHEDISRFFLFDGEMLNEYEDLLNDPDRAPALVRRSIEQILGLPALESAEAELDDLRAQSERKQLQETRKSKENERLIKDAQQKEEELGAIVRDIAHSTEIKEQLDAKRTALRQDRDRFAEIQAEVRALDEKEQELEEIQRTQKEQKERCQALLSSTWWMPLESRLDRAFEVADAQDRKERERFKELAGLRQRVEGIRQIQQKLVCDLCGQNVEEARRTQLSSQLSELMDSLRRLDAESESQRSSRDELALLRPFVGKKALSELFLLETDIRRARMRAGRIERAIGETKKKVREHERAEIQRLEREYDECVTQLKDVSRLLEQLDNRRSLTHGTLERLRQRIRSLPEADKRLAAEAILYGSLATLFGRSVDTFRDQVRRDVESEATRIHQMLTSEREYDRLRINDQYGLVLLNKEGRTIRQRSAGSEQILALALIGALNKCATREAPVIMDTPFGRLDVSHRANILKYAPSFGRQVILLVQSGEFDPLKDMGYIAGKVSREFRIHRAGASDRSVIEPITQRVEGKHGGAQRAN